MACSCCDFTGPAGRQFDARMAAKQLKAYRRGKVGSTTRFLRDGLVRARLNSGTLLDVGAGIGALTFELLERGFGSAVAVEASSAYLTAAREEAARHRPGAVSFVYGDFVRVASQVAAADVVTLDRVVCCYDDYRALLTDSTARARRGVALSYPRDRWFVRAAIFIENAIRQLRSNTFRTFVHPVSEMERLIRDAGFDLVGRRQTAAWTSAVYVRRPGSAT